MSPVIGVIGGGQLARMMVPAAIGLGLEFRVLAETEGSSARLAASMIGDYRDVQTVTKFAESVDVVTFDHEHVPTDILVGLERAGVAVRPNAAALVFAQDKALMRERLSTLDVPLPGWSVARETADVEAFLDRYGGEVIAKTPRGGYDGKGVRVITAATQVSDWLSAGLVLLEEKVAFRRELAQLIARRPSGGVQVFPLVETRQRNGVCAEVIAPAPETPRETVDEAKRIARVIAEELDVVGVLAVELFQREDGRLVVNELAMRPHNSGHVFTEAATTSQFTQHLRAVADWPLGDTTLHHPWAVMVNLFGDAGPERVQYALTSSSRVSIHAYGKDARPGRKAGHLVVTGDDLDEVLGVARAAARWPEVGS